MKKVTVIGAGLGGLSAAIRLACKGFDVTVYEMNSAPGGKARSIQMDGFRFDTGPSLLTMPFVIEELFNHAGENITNYLTIKRLDTLCRYFYSDGTVLSASSDIHKFSKEIEIKTSEKKENLQKFLKYCKKIYDLTSNVFLFNDLHSASTYTNLGALKTLLGIRGIDSFRTMNKANRSFFADEKIIQLFNRYATYNGSNPYQCPATLNVISHVEYNLGGYYIEGGMFKLTNALHSLALKKGVRFEFNSKVQEIKISGKSVTGIIINNKFISSDIVISNADVYNTYNVLLKNSDSKTASKYNTLESSSSAHVFYWGIKINSEKLAIHNILFSSDYKKEFDEIFGQKIYPSDPTVYIYISSKFSKADAPEGCENWFVMINTPCLNENAQKSNNELKEIILSKIKLFTGYEISDKIISEHVLSPGDLESLTGSYKGSIYGISSNNKKAAFLRQRNKSAEFKGLYFCGGSAHPGGGIPLVILSGKICAENIIKTHKKH